MPNRSLVSVLAKAFLAGEATVEQVDYPRYRGRWAGLGAGFGPSPGDSWKPMRTGRAPGAGTWFGFCSEIRVSDVSGRNTPAIWRWSNGFPSRSKCSPSRRLRAT